MSTLLKPAVSGANPERTVQELLLEWLGRYFNGTVRHTPLGDQRFPACDLLFGDAMAPDPKDKPQLHGIIAQMPSCMEQWGQTDASPWIRVAASPASGVSYGVTLVDTIEETVHGRVRRTLPGTDIRWRTVGSALVEETLRDGMWVSTRTFTNTTALRWSRDRQSEATDYVEQQIPSFDEVRRVSPEHSVWDGECVRVVGALRIQWFARVLTKGQTTQEADNQCRAVTDALKQLFQREGDTFDLAEKGLRHWRVTGGNLASMPGITARTVGTACEADYLVPVERSM